jgi:hypothetical protein
MNEDTHKPKPNHKPASHDFRAARDRISRAGGQTSLGDDVLRLIVSSVASSYEPNGIRGTGVVARDLCNIALASRDLRAAAYDAGFGALASAISRHRTSGLPAVEGSAVTWDIVVSDPMSAKLPDLRAAARAIGAKVTGTKPELVVRLLGFFGIARPSRVHPIVLRDLQQLRRLGFNELGTLDWYMAQLGIAYSPAASVYIVQNALARRFGTYQAMRAGAVDAMRERSRACCVSVRIVCASCDSFGFVCGECRSTRE